MSAEIMTIDSSVPLNNVEYGGWKDVSPKRKVNVSFDVSQIYFAKSTKNNEKQITTAEQMTRYENSGYISFDANIVIRLIKEPGQVTLNEIYKLKGVEWFACLGAKIMNSAKKNFTIFISRRNKEDRWYYSYFEISNDVVVTEKDLTVFIKVQ